MAGYLIGLGVLAFLAWRLWSHRTPPGATVFSGTVVAEVSVRSTRTGSRRRLYAPRVAYRHPQTGRDEVHEPTEFGSHRFTVGEQTPLVHDPMKDRVFRPLDRPIKDALVLSLVGVGFIVAQYLD